MKLAAIYISIGLTAALVMSYDLNVMALGDEMASSLGMRTGIYRFIFIIIASLLAGSF